MIFLIKDAIDLVRDYCIFEIPGGFSKRRILSRFLIIAAFLADHSLFFLTAKNSFVDFFLM
jgi:hypothetical protein